MKNTEHGVKMSELSSQDMQDFTSLRGLLLDNVTKIDSKGHYHEKKYGKKNLKDKFCLFFMYPSHVSIDDRNMLNQAIKNKKKTNKYVDLGSSSLLQCSECGEEVEFETNGKTLRAKNKCKYPNGLPQLEFDMDFSSGKIVVANDLREPYEEDLEDTEDINTHFGTNQLILAYAKLGMAHAFVGNTSPGVYKTDKNEYAIGTRGWIPKSDEDGEDVKGERICSICTDLWWYSIVDLESFKKRTKMSENKIKKEYNANILDITPGIYRFTYTYYENRDRKDGKPEIYSIFKKIK